MSRFRSPWLILGLWLIVLSLLGWISPSGIVSRFALLCGLFFYGQQFGAGFLPTRSRALQILLGVLTLLATQSVLQTAWYYSGQLLTHQTDLLTFLASIVLLHAATFWWHKESQPFLEEAGVSWSKKTLVWSLVTLLPTFFAVIFILSNAYSHGTTDAIRTPWPLLPAGALMVFAILLVSSWLCAWKTRSVLATTIAASLTLLAVSCLTPLLYKLGFGFDGFLHRASEVILLNTGTLNPHPPYYIGQYVFVTWLARLFTLPLRGIDTLLVPVLTLLLPIGFLLTSASRKTSAWIIAASLVLFPLSILVATTPQSLAYLLGFFGICLAIAVRQDDQKTAIPALLLAGWSLAAHPLAGLPFFAITITLLILTSIKESTWVTKIIKYLFLIGGLLSVTLVIPVIFFLRSSVTNTAWNWQPLFQAQTYTSAIISSLSSPKTHVVLWADWASFVEYLAPLVLLLLALIACIRDRQNRSVWVVLMIGSVGLLAAGLLLHTAASFTFLIDYERGDYADRLWILSQLFLLPAAASTLGLLLERQTRSTLFLTLFIFAFGGAWFAARVYTAFPRHDAVVVGHGWSVSRADQDAVHWIDRDAQNEPYTVLANQSTSAAAVEAFGFKRYINEVFYYPIPTGGPLYQDFLKAVAEDPSIDAIKDAASLGQTSLVYVVLNDYWWESSNVAEKLSRLAEKSVVLTDGRIRVYRFRVNTSSKD